ncbi:MAG: MBL fold metallo-hydrolase [Prolixibacteraceae bacterium]|nr:MBL fold metallo-hydrolase [Prolixibacteraceae bacterium]MBT6006433.1 MBL fold metallo-hydrolase [Prolixibacteraceae bacterium]MBT6763200.1 MBL fold metallo-hydrolase [Prolixibacteraceae bacterium]MBT6997393.1 MBL fold metallo-hydrolase [Prolixibacteraceae bacterium]MBT7396604.1 MBL fold metallo-hydrolase [Prolixibacteraceae bacterium]
MVISLSIVILFGMTVLIFMKHPKFGRIPTGERLEKIQKSPHFVNGTFRNLNHTPQITGDKGFFGMMREYFSATNKKPINAIPSIKTDLLDLNSDENVLVWFGHSSYFIQIDGKRILVDPVFSGHSSPFSFSVKAFNGTDQYSEEDIPEIDYLVITHDHWDHLDYKTVVKLKSKVKKIITGLGTGSHFERWGFEPKLIVEMDWFEKNDFENGFVFHATPARHFSGRGFIHKKTLWVSFVLETPTTKIFIGGDGGYDTHFAEIGKKFGEFDLAILENGQYNTSWKYIHMMPEQVLQAAKDLNAKRVFPVHNSKFALANHSWNTPLKTISELNKNNEVLLVTPKIGELVKLKGSAQYFSKWWDAVD